MALVLVASDLPSLRASVRATLEGPDLEILEASSGPEAIEEAVDNEVELAILAGGTFEDDALRPVTVGQRPAIPNG